MSSRQLLKIKPSQEQVVEVAITNPEEIGNDAIAGATLNVGVHDIGRNSVGATLGRIVFTEITLK
jgi:hypothetical protein